MLLTVKFNRETDGRWIGKVSELPGVLAYGATRKGCAGQDHGACPPRCR
jgi:predicted RNase H-like HicB family nuclease